MLTRIELEALKSRHPIEVVAAGYGVDLRRAGRSLVGRCPIHRDRGRPNFHVYRGSGSWYCYRCGIGGDVVSLLQKVEGLAFREALERLESEGQILHRRSPIAIRPATAHQRSPEERACLAAAVELYHNTLLAEEPALSYVLGRGIDRETIVRCRIGYARGDQLLPYLRWRRLPIGAARRTALLRRDGADFMAGRVVVPELRGGQPIWLIGRRLDDGEPRYLGLPGRKPLLGWEGTLGQDTVYLVEGVFDLLALRSWGLPALALAGTRVRTEMLRAFSHFRRIYLVLDNDPAGREAAAILEHALGPRAMPVVLPGVKDVADLAREPGGHERFLVAVHGASMERAA